MYKIAFILLFALMMTSFAWANNEKITIAAFEYPPVYQNANDKGLAGDLVVEAFKAVGIDTEIQFFPAARMVTTVVSGQVMCGIGGRVLFAAADVAPKVSIAAPIMYVSQVFFYDTKKFTTGLTWTELSELSKYNIGVLFSSGIHKFLEKTKELKLDPNPAHDGSAGQLQMGRINLWAIVDLTGTMYMNKLFPKEALNFKYTKAFNRGDVSVVFSNKMDPNGIYASKFKEGLAQIKKNGTYMKVMAKYYGGADKINNEALIDDMK